MSQRKQHSIRIARRAFTLVELLIVIGIIAGFITGKLMQGSGYGMFMDMVIGLVGAVVGGFLATHLGLAGPGQSGMLMTILIAVVGAVSSPKVDGLSMAVAGGAKLV